MNWRKLLQPWCKLVGHNWSEWYSEWAFFCPVFLRKCNRCGVKEYDDLFFPRHYTYAGKKE